MLKLIRDQLEQIIKNIDSGNSNISQEDQFKLLDTIQYLTSPELSKSEAANYIGKSRATFDNYISNGWIPKGRKRSGFKELSWRKSDLDKFLEQNK